MKNALLIGTIVGLFTYIILTGEMLPAFLRGLGVQ